MMKSQKKIRLGVNVDHVATLRQVRGGTTSYPDVLKMVQQAVQGGAEQITIHLREDRRHIQLSDLILLSQKCPVPLNLEMAATPQMVSYALKYKPDWVCFVPEKRAELTTEGGLNVVKAKKKLAPMVEKLQRIGIEISMFVEPSAEQIEASYAIGADAVELHTGHWVLLTGAKKEKEFQRLIAAAHLAHELEMNVHAGHGLDYHHTKLIRELPHLQEVNIGHSLISYALEEGLKKSVQKMKSCLKK